MKYMRFRRWIRNTQWQIAPQWWKHLFDFGRRKYHESDDVETWTDNYIFIGPLQIRWYDAF